MTLGATLFLFFVFFGYAGPAFPAQGGKPAYDEKKVADFYQGKTVRIVVGFSAGGGYDQYSRVIARHLSKYIPGNPAVIVDNMPGVGSIIAANHIYNAAPKDGTAIGNISGPIVIEQLFGSPSVQYDMGKFRYLAVPVSETYLMVVVKKTGVTKFDDVVGPKSKQVSIGAFYRGACAGSGARRARRQPQSRFRLQRHRRRQIGDGERRSGGLL